MQTIMFVSQSLCMQWAAVNTYYKFTLFIKEITLKKNNDKTVLLLNLVRSKISSTVPKLMVPAILFRAINMPLAPI